MNDQFNGTPVNHEKVNEWMIAHGWEWYEKRIPIGEWHKGELVVSQELAAEFYQMVVPA